MRPCTNKNCLKYDTNIHGNCGSGVLTSYCAWHIRNIQDQTAMTFKEVMVEDKDASPAEIWNAALRSCDEALDTEGMSGLNMENILRAKE